ncbi:MAG: TonB-dependent receptor [Panacagrimonas sp.]
MPISPKAATPLRLIFAASLFSTALPLAAQDAEPEAIPFEGELPTIPVEVGEGEPKPANPAPQNTALDVIVVTAQKRDENLIDVPLSVQAFSGESLEARGITDQNGLEQITPGLHVGEQAQFSTIFLRGVGSDAFLMADPSVASYIDGIYFPFAQGLAQDFGAVERVEILKGPQGTLFGRNAVGGAISVYTRDPSFSGNETSIQTLLGNRSTREVRLYQNLALTDSLAINVSGLYSRADHYMEGTANGEPLQDEIARGVRVKLRWAPTDNLDLIFAGLRLEQEGSGSVFQLNASPSRLLGSTLLGIDAQTGYEGALSESTFLDFTNTVYYGQATYNTPWFDVKLLGSDQEARAQFAYDFDGSEKRIAAFEQKLNFADIQTAELQLISNDKSWGADWFEWIVGGYYFYSAQGFDTANLQLLGLDLADFQDNGISLPAPLINALNALNIAFPNGDVAFHAIIGTNSQSAFAQGTITFTDWLALTLGARYQDEERRIIQSDSGLFLSNGGFFPLFNWNVLGARDGDGRAFPIQDTTTSFSPKGTLELRPFGKDTLFYFTYQEALKSATYNTVAIYQRPAHVKPEEIEAIEIGFKTTLLDGSAQLSLAAFDYDITNLQVQFISLLQGGAVSFENADAASIQGAEFVTTFQVLPRVFDRLVFNAAGSWIDGQYDRYVDASGFDPDSGLFSPNNDYSGNRVVRTPEFSATVALAKTWTIDNGELELGGDVYYNDGFFYAASNADNLSQENYTLFGARVSYLYVPWGLRATLLGRNLSDEKYSQGLIATDFGGNVTLAPPVTYGLRLSWDF